MLKNWENAAALLYRTKIIPPDGRTFPSANTYLDLCITDERIKFTDFNSNKMTTMHYNSDHRALVLTASLNNALETTNPGVTHRYMFKKTKWEQFTKKLNRNYNQDITNTRNLTTEEIEAHLAEIEAAIKITIAQVVPKYKPNDNIFNYISILNQKTPQIQILHINLLTPTIQTQQYIPT